MAKKFTHNATMTDIEATAPAQEQLLFDPSVKKKKKSKPKFDVDSVDATSSKKEATAGDGSVPEFEFTKKKKKSKSSAAASFEAQLEQAGVNAEGAGDEVSSEPKQPAPAKLDVNSEGEAFLTYDELLDRFYEVLRENNPDLAGDRSGVKYKIPPPQVGRDGNKKTLFSNLKAISDRMHRPMDHVIHFLFAELGTSGSVDGSERLVIKGRFQQKQIEGVLRRYITEYVTCKLCRSINTKLIKENRLYFVECNSCGSKRSVSSIKVGYQAVIRRPRKK